jgi:hypothetical protein
MGHLRILYHMVRADFLERVRRYSFLLTLAAAIYLGYAVYRGEIAIQLDTYSGVNNAAWLGSVMGLVATMFLTLIGFYVVKNSIQRDRETRVGRILASTPMSKSLYTVAKWLSNLAVLGTMIVVLAVAALLIEWSHAGLRVDYFALLSPVIVFGLSAVAVAAALAVLFETVPWLRGGLGNIFYFFLWTALLTFAAISMIHGGGMTTLGALRDFAGIATVMGQMQAQVHQLDTLYRGGASFKLGSMDPTTKTFLWTGLRWNLAIMLSRVLWLGIAGGLALVAAVFFDRFDPAKERSIGRSKKSTAVPLELGTLDASVESRGGAMPSVRSVADLTPLSTVSPALGRGRFFSLVYAESLLLVRGLKWWWYAGAAGLFLASAVSPLADARSGIIVAAWIWPALLWSQMGTREARFSTQALIYSAPRAFPRQLLSTWAAGFLVTVITGGGLALRLLVARDFQGLGAWAAGAVFIPSLALALGACTESRKPFEALYTAWWYLGPLHHLAPLDFMGTTADSSRPGAYLVAATLLVGVASGWRWLRLSRR